MGNRIRHIEPFRLYNITVRCNDRQFLLKPNHAPKHPLLAAGCPPLSLLKSNDRIPISSTLNTIGYSLARAQELRPIPLYWAEYSINHGHIGAATNPEKPGHLAEFMQIAQSGIARKLNKQWQREGHLFTGPYHIEPILDDMSAEQKLTYSLANPLKDNLIERISENPFFSCYPFLAKGEELKFWQIDYEAYWDAGGPYKGKRLKDFLIWKTLEISPLPHWEELSVHQRQTKVRILVREQQEAAEKARKAQGATAIGVQQIMDEDPRNRPKNPKDSGPQPLCHTADPELRKAYEEQWRELQREYFEASWDFRMGMWEREFPDGTYRPPIKTIFDSSRR